MMHRVIQYPQEMSWVGSTKARQSLEDILNALAASGWEVVTVDIEQHIVIVRKQES